MTEAAKKPSVSISGFALKIIAMVTMAMDHTAVAFSLPNILRAIGRLAFPLYALMAIDSYLHLKSDPKRLKRYLVTLCILAAVSELGYNFVDHGTWLYTGSQNQILQFVTFLAGIIIADTTDKIFPKVIVWGAVIVFNCFWGLGYGGSGIVLMLGLCIYLGRFREQPLWKRVLALCGVFLTYYISIGLEYGIIPRLLSGHRYGPLALIRTALSGIYAECASVFVIPVIVLYNGEYGSIPKGFRWIYRVFYPVHLYLLALLKAFVFI